MPKTNLQEKGLSPAPSPAKAVAKAVVKKERCKMAQKSLCPAQSSTSGTALGGQESRRAKHPRHTFLAWFEAHPALSIACPPPAFVAELTAHPLYCHASRSSVQRWEVIFGRRAPSRPQSQSWQHVYDIDVGFKQRGTLLTRAALCDLLVLRLMHFRRACGVRDPLRHATYVVSRRHYLVPKCGGNGMFQEGQLLYEQQRFSDAARIWAQAALLQHGPSHAFLSSMLFEGRQDVSKHKTRAFEVAAAGAALGCAHSKGALSRCLVLGVGVARSLARGLALGRESAAAGSCFGRCAVGICYDEGLGVAQDYAEAARLYSLAAEQGDAVAQNNLGAMFESGRGVAQDFAEAVRLYHPAAAHGDATAQNNLGYLFQHGLGVARDDAEGVRLYHLAAAQGDANAQAKLGYMFQNGLVRI
jgi:hypothetical protein